MQRYSRQTALPEIGGDGQKKLQGSTVAIVGLGGTGCAAASSLAGMGIGKLVIIDPDVVEECNLHRQLLYRKDDVGKKKVVVAAERLREINSDLAIETQDSMLKNENAEFLLRDSNLVVDGSDNNACRMAINKACLRLGKPWVYGAAEEFEGRLSLFRPGGPCFSCVMQDNKDSGCQAVLGAVPQLIGTAQALEVVKFILNIGEVSERLMVFEGKAGTWKELSIKKNPECKVCGK